MGRHRQRGLDFCRKGRYFLSALLIFSVIIGMMPSLVRADTDESAQSAKVLKVGFFAFDGYHMQDSTGRRSGYGYDFLQEMGRYGSWTYEYVGYDRSWSEMQDMLASGEIDILTSAQKTPEREEKFAFSSEPIGTNSAILTVKSGDTRWTAGDYATYEGMRIGLVKGSSRNSSLVSFAAEHGFSYTPVYYESVKEMKSDLQAGVNVDAIFSSNLRSVNNEWILDQFDSSDFYLMVRKDDQELLSEIDAAIAQMDLDMNDWRHDLWNKYYTPDTGDEIAFTPAERSFIREAQAKGTVFQVLLEPDRKPFSYFKNGAAKGIIARIFMLAAEKTGLSFSLVQTANREDYFSRVRNPGEISIRADAFFDFYDAEEMGYKLTDSYLTASVSEVKRKSLLGEPSKAALVKTADPTDYSRSLRESGMTILEFETRTECLDAVRNGTADVTYIPTYTAQEYINENDPNGILISSLMPQFSVSYAIGVRSSADSSLLTILSKAVGSLGSSETEAIINEETATGAQNQTLTQFLMRNPLFAVLAVAAVVLIAVLAAIVIARRRNMKIIAKKNEELRAEALRADHASAAKSAFLSGVSHDMRTPLNGVINFTQFGLQSATAEEKQNYLEKVRDSATILKSLINDTLEVSRIESGKLQLQEESVNCRHLIDGIATVIANAAAEKSLHFHSENEIPANIYLIADKLKMQDLLLNLLNNAVKYTPEGGDVSLYVTKSEPDPAGRNFHMVISDTGIGFSKEFLPHAFEPFVQEDDAAVRKTSGTGLGLYLVKRIVDLMKGEIRIESEKGRGTKITVDLPMRMEEKGEEQKSGTAEEWDFSGRKILVVEDNDINAEIMQLLLTSKGIIPVRAVDGREAVTKFTASGEGEFDAVLMDINMPVMNGYEATQAIRALKRPDAARVPIIAMTANAYKEDIEKCLSAGMNGHIPKPSDSDVLFRTIRVKIS